MWTGRQETGMQGARETGRVYLFPWLPLFYTTCTSTDNTAGKSRTMGVQLSPESVDA